MKRVVCLSLCVLVLVFSLVACSSSTNRSYTFNVETGDSVNVSMVDTDGYHLSQSNVDGVTFLVKGTDETKQVAGGIFMGKENGASLLSTVSASGTVFSHKSLRDCYERTYNDGTNNITGFIGIISDNTYILVDYNCDKALAEKLFNALSFSIE